MQKIHENYWTKQKNGMLVESTRIGKKTQVKEIVTWETHEPSVKDHMFINLLDGRHMSFTSRCGQDRHVGVLNIVNRLIGGN